MDVFLVDTNVLVYAHDPRDRAKQERAILVLDTLVANERASLSVQGLAEFYSVVTTRLPEPINPPAALDQVRRFARTFRVFEQTPAVVLEGCRGAARYRLSLWDALVWSVAKLNQVPCILTEDAAHGRALEGVSYLNPFHAAFDLGVLRASASP